jgi:hypothetical protein
MLASRFMPTPCVDSPVGQRRAGAAMQRAIGGLEVFYSVSMAIEVWQWQ